MAKRIKIEFVSNPTPTVNLVFQVSYPPLSNTIGASIGSIAVPIGATKEDTAENLYNYYLTLLLYDWIEFTLNSNIIYIDFTPEDDNNLSFPFLISSSSSILITEEIAPEEQPLQTALIRSTYSLRTTPAVLFDTASLELFIWSGDITEIPNQYSYALSKPVVQLGQTSINFDINQLLKDGVKPQISNYLLSGVQPTPYDLTCWAYYDVKIFDGEVNVYEWSGTLFCIYGYGYFSEGYNPTNPSKILINGDKHLYYEDEDSRVYFITDGLESLEVNGDAVSITADTNLNTEYLQSINLKDYEAENGQIVLTFDYGEEETRTITFDVLCEIKYEVVNCVFINKYGMPQSFFFTKVKKVTDDIESDNYRGLQSEFGVYNTTKFQYKEFNKNGRTKITLNTNNLTENQNDVIKELLYSEYIWLIEDGIIYPVTLESKSMAYKTSLNEKQIQYTMDFKYAFDTINTVQ